VLLKVDWESALEKVQRESGEKLSSSQKNAPAPEAVRIQPKKP
jgi:hypothetical protein